MVDATEPISGQLVSSAETNVLGCALSRAHGSHEGVEFYSALLDVEPIAAIARNIGHVWAGSGTAGKHDQRGENNVLVFHRHPFPVKR